MVVVHPPKTNTESVRRYFCLKIYCIHLFRHNSSYSVCEKAMVEDLTLPVRDLVAVVPTDVITNATWINQPHILLKTIPLPFTYRFNITASGFNKSRTGLAQTAEFVLLLRSLHATWHFGNCSTTHVQLHMFITYYLHHYKHLIQRELFNYKSTAQKNIHPQLGLAEL
jgi:hypothetical protein